MATPDRPPPNDSGRRPGESMTEYVIRLEAHIKEVERQAAEERLLADLTAQRLIESERQAVRFSQLLQEELRQRDEQLRQRDDQLRQRDDKLRQRDDQTNPQALAAYLAQVSRLQTHAARLLPQPGGIPPHVQRSSASGAGSRSSSPQPTTSGRTDIAKKYYPLRLRPWVEFRDEVQQKGFARIYGALQQSTQHGLPSRAWVQFDEEMLLENLPLLALNQKGALNAARTHNFLKTVLLSPASRILNEYLNHGLGATKKIFFDADVQSVASVFPSVSSMEYVEVAEDAEGAENADSPQNTRSASNAQPRKVMPDCLVLCMDSGTTTTNPVQLIASAEHKPLHAIRAASVSNIINGPLPEDLMIRLARQTLTRREKERAKERAKQRRSAERGRASASAPQTETEPGLASDATSETQKIDKLTYFAYALTQAYHYMLMAGVEFGFLATGEVLVFLRILEEDATTLYYHASLFPIPGFAAEDTNRSSGSNAQLTPAATRAPYPAPGDPVGEEALAELPIAQLASFCEYAMHAERRSPSWAVEQTAKLAHFPNLPPGIAARYDQRPSSQLGRRRRDDDGDGDGDGDSDSNDDNGGNGPSRRQLQVPYRSSRVRTASPLQHEISSRQSPEPADVVDPDISTTFLSTPCDLQTRPRPSRKVERPALPYCTHACLLGLVQNGPLDSQCPNYALHQAAGRQEQEKDTCSRHPLTSFELARRIRDQLFDTPEVDCECSLWHRGAVGYPFKLTLTGFGYTFVGKAVKEEYRRRLVRESKIYKALFPLQGSIIPVHLGLIRLHVGYPIMSQFLQLPYMMLLSYAGESMLESLIREEEEESGRERESISISPEMARDRAEAARTERELSSWGLDDEDHNVSNFRWCAEAGRAMRIDFDRAYLVPLQRQKRPLRVSTDLHASDASQTSQLSCSSQTASSNDTPTTQMLEEPDYPDLAGKMQGESSAKRRKLNDDSNELVGA